MTNPPGCRVLVADPAEIDRRTMALTLRELSREIAAVASIEQAERMFATEPPFDLLVVDQGFPLDTLRPFLERVCREQPGVAVVLTGQEIRAVSHLHDLYARKPFDVEWLIESVRRLLTR